MCFVVYFFVNDLWMYVKLYIGDKFYKCRYCNYSFFNSWWCNMYEWCYEKFDDNKCNKCGVIFSNVNDLIIYEVNSVIYGVC